MLGLGLLGLLVTSCSDTTVSSHGGGALTGKDAQQVVRLALRAAKAAGSVHYVLVSHRGGTSETISGDAGLASGRQSVMSGGDRVQALLVNGTAYVHGNAAGLENVLGLTSAVAGKYEQSWISLVRYDQPYASIVDAVLLDHVLAQVTPSGSLTLVQPGSARPGQGTAVGVRGGLPSPVQGASGWSSLDVSTSSPTVPTRFTGVAGRGAKAVQDQATFSDWGRSLDLSVPAGTIPYESLPTE